MVSKWTGIPLNKLLEGQIEKLLKMEERMKMRVVGQDEAVGLVSSCIRRARSGLSDPNRPMGVFVFVGPTGVGKTELAKSLAWFLFDDDQAIVRLDMSEYMEKHSVARLIGAPPGYVGYEEGGQLTEAIRRRPYAVILFDEIEKAHPDVFNILLQIFDDGRLTDGQGRVVNFKNTVLILTSNLGTGQIEKGDSKEDMRKKVLSEFRKHLRPEFLNRIDEIIVFNHLSRGDMDKIVDIQLSQIKERLLAHGLRVILTKDARQTLARQGYEPDFGARPLKRLIEKRVVDPLSVKVLNREFKPGSMIEIDLRNEDSVFKELEG